MYLKKSMITYVLQSRDEKADLKVGMKSLLRDLIAQIDKKILLHNLHFFNLLPVIRPPAA